MKTFQIQAAQGDLLITRVEALPDGLVQQKPENDQHVLAHSETGHHHVVEADAVEYFHAPANDDDFAGQVAYLRVNKPVALRHLRSFDTHAPLRILEGLYRLNRQREYTPEGFRRAAD
jgi:hypothetical protein